MLECPVLKLGHIVLAFGSKSLTFFRIRICLLLIFHIWIKKRVLKLKINYNKLWKLLIDKGMNKTDLKNATGISSSTIAKMGKNEPVSMDSMLKVCKVLNCDIGDIVEVKNSEAVEQEEEMEM